ncbi:MAG TPA: hypothetical protein VFN94_06030 [Nitrospiria bacterium]|nr:hypothetical protein [Nitrospiria bacterium]
MAVTALAACLARRGRRVLVGQTHEQDFGVVFGLCGRTPPEPSGVVVTSDLGVRLSRMPLVGVRRPGVLIDGALKTQWDACVGEADVVVIHVNHDGGILWTQEIPCPDEFVTVAGAAAHASLLRSYEAIKRVVYRNSDAVLRLATTDPDGRAESRWRGVARAVETFLGRQCLMDSAFHHVSAMASAFLAGRLCRDGGGQVIRTMESIMARWGERASPRANRSELPGYGAPWGIISAREPAR